MIIAILDTDGEGSDVILRLDKNKKVDKIFVDLGNQFDIGDDPLKYTDYIDYDLNDLNVLNDIDDEEYLFQKRQIIEFIFDGLGTTWDTNITL